MNEDFKAAKKKLEARKRIKELQKDVRLEKAYLHFGLESPKLSEERRKREFEAQYSAVPLEKKQAFMDLWRNGGIGLGDAAEKVGITTEVASQVLLRNVTEYNFWKDKVET